MLDSRFEQIVQSYLNGEIYSDPPMSRMEELLIALIKKAEAGGADPDTIKHIVIEYLNAHPIDPYDDTEIRKLIASLKGDLTKIETAVNGKYSKPTDGIPETDLSAAVLAKLNSGGENWELIEKHTDLSADVRNIITDAKVVDYQKFLVFLSKPAANTETVGYMRACTFRNRGATNLLFASDTPKNSARLSLYVEFISDNVVMCQTHTTAVNPTGPLCDVRIIPQLGPDETFGIYNNNGLQCYDGTETLWIFGVRR